MLSAVIVGSGPSGLVLALSLLQNGIHPRIIEKKPHYPLGHRGSGIQPRSFELHKLLKTLPDILDKAIPPVPVGVYAPPDGTKVVKTINMFKPMEPNPSIPYLTPLSLGQSNQEAILRAHLAKYSCEVELATELRSFEQFNDHVVVHLVKTMEDGQQVEEEVECHYLIGADGAHSVVRKQLGLTFLGETREDAGVFMGDIEVLSGLGKDYWHMWGHPAKSGATLRPTENGNIFSMMVTRDPKAPKDEIPTREKLIQMFSDMSGRKDIEFGKLVFSGNYRPNIRMVDSFGKGRVFVVGDAAHVHSPTGGQGANSSIQDSFNLGWKMALVIQNLSPPSLLDTFSAERLPVIAEMLNITTELLDRNIKASTDEESWKRGGALLQLGVNCRGSSIVIDERTPWDKMNHSPAYRGSLAGVVCAGDRAPDAPGLIGESGEQTSLFDTFGSFYHTVLVFPGEEGALDSVLKPISRYPKDKIRTVIIAPSESTLNSEIGTLLKDQDGHAYKGYSISKERTTTVVVRPDGTVGAIVFGAEGLERYFDGIFL